MLVATHDGSFHADEVFAIAALGLLGEPIEVIRTRNRDDVARADLRVDVGFRNDPATGDFDHHQREFDAVRDNGVRYASFGLVWREFGPRVCDGEAEVAQAVDSSLVQAVDANDTGQQLTHSLIDGVRPMTANAIVGGFNARWDETLSAEQERARFDDAVALAQGILAREIASAASGRRAEKIVREAIATAMDPRLVELPVNAPWKQVLVPDAPEALFVIYPKRQGFGLESVPRELGSFENRRDLPAEWGGREGADLVAVTGVEDALFCHAKRFLAVARTHDGITSSRRARAARRMSDPGACSGSSTLRTTAGSSRPPATSCARGASDRTGCGSCSRSSPGLGRSATSRRYAIASLQEAEAYLAHPVLGPRLIACALILSQLRGPSATDIFGSVDAMKLRSSMTLFAFVRPGDPVFAQILDVYFGGGHDPATERLLD